MNRGKTTKARQSVLNECRREARAVHRVQGPGKHKPRAWIERLGPDYAVPAEPGIVTLRLPVADDVEAVDQDAG